MSSLPWEARALEKPAAVLSSSACALAPLSRAGRAADRMLVTSLLLDLVVLLTPLMLSLLSSFFALAYTDTHVCNT